MNANEARLNELAEARRALMPEHDEPTQSLVNHLISVHEREQELKVWERSTPTIPGKRCLQCRGAAHVKHIDLRWGQAQISYWCNEDYDHWWMYRTVRNLHGLGYKHISQMVRWPD